MIPTAANGMHAPSPSLSVRGVTSKIWQSFNLVSSQGCEVNTSAMFFWNVDFGLEGHCWILVIFFYSICCTSQLQQNNNFKISLREGVDGVNLISNMCAKVQWLLLLLLLLLLGKTCKGSTFVGSFFVTWQPQETLPKPNKAPDSVLLTREKDHLYPGLFFKRSFDFWWIEAIYIFGEL